MNASELADRIATDHDLDKKQSKQVVDAVFAAVVAATSGGDEVSIPGFGKFKVTVREARTGRNPATQETIQIPASKKLAFQPAKQVKDTLNPAQKPATSAKPAPKAKAKPKAKK